MGLGLPLALTPHLSSGFDHLPNTHKFVLFILDHCCFKVSLQHAARALPSILIYTECIICHCAKKVVCASIPYTQWKLPFCKQSTTEVIKRVQSAEIKQPAWVFAQLYTMLPYQVLYWINRILIDPIFCVYFLYSAF